MDDPSTTPTPASAATAATPSAPTVSAAPPSPAPPPVPPGSGPPDPDEEWDDADSILSWKLLVAIAVVVGALGLAALVIVNGRKSDSASSATTGTDPKGGGGAAEPPSIRDSFDRPDTSASLGKTATGEDWETVAGTWGIQGKQAYISSANDKGPRNIAVVDLGSGNGSVQAKAAKLTNGWGLVFRYRGPNAFWTITASTPAKTFNITKYDAGKATPLGNTGLVKYDEGATVKVEYVGATITVFVNGNPVHTLTDTYLQAQGTKAGIYGEGAKVAEARWSEFVARKGLEAPTATAAPKASVPRTTAPGATVPGATVPGATVPGAPVPGPTAPGGAASSLPVNSSTTVAVGAASSAPPSSAPQ